MPKLSTDLAIRALVFTIFTTAICVDLNAQSAKAQTEGPAYRTGDASLNPGYSKSGSENEAATPIVKALNIAEDTLQYIRTDIRDYTATMIKRERVDGLVGDAEFIDIKIRNEREAENIPFSIYMKFKKPANIKGREVLWVEGRNGNKLTAHEGTGLLKHITADLDPDGTMAMRGNRYPIYEAGIENLTFRLIEKGQRDKEIGDAEVKFFNKIKINGRECTLIQVKHPTERKEYDFHICRVFIDKELNVPVRYAAYDWPEEKGNKPALMEEYTYLNMKLNQGLTDADFDRNNSKYNF